jgi:hypothetical protein
MRAMDNGAAGGGAPPRFEGVVPLFARLLLWWVNFFMRLAGITGGECMFCSRQAFYATAGFDERLYGAEDSAFAWAIKQEGPFVVLWRYVLTSGRRVRGVGGLQMLATLVRMAFFPRMLKKRKSVGKIWYESNREGDDSAAHSWGVQISNAVMLAIVFAIVTGPIWMFIPWSLTPEGSLSFKLRIGIAILSCHVALVLWPCTFFLFRILLRQRRWIERIKLTVLIALCLWFAWGATREVIWFWVWFSSRLAG